MKHHYIWDKRTNETPAVTLDEWGAWIQDNSRDKHVGDEFVDKYRVSTVFLGLDHRFGGEGPPLIWETMVFSPGGSDDYCERYATYEEALAGHHKAIEWVKKNKSVEGVTKKVLKHYAGDVDEVKEREDAIL
jgi:hypothetical protein